MSNEAEVSELFRNWVNAIQNRELDAVLSHHTSDVVMFEAFPDRRLRITVGLRKESGEWAIAHEHHSFTVRSEEL